jgi:hypothetical protein
MLVPATDALNQLTARHLDFQYRRVLGFEPLPAEPEHAHLTLALKKGRPPSPSRRPIGSRPARAPMASNASMFRCMTR